MRQCWSSLTNVPGYLLEILNSLFTGKIDAYGAACCEAITRISDNCWTQLFPFNPFYPSLVIDSFAAGSSTARIGQTMAAKHSSPGQSTLPFLGLSSAGQPGQDIAWCWSSLSSIEGCVYDIYGSLSRGQFRGIGTAYCRAITDVNDICWPQMFPLAIYSFISSLAHSITLKRLVRHYIIRYHQTHCHNYVSFGDQINSIAHCSHSCKSRSLDFEQSTYVVCI
ncbi:hypothetical protein I3760_03G070600 [Carya illinoinensis]|nr:hypothetical protein I3760_03G070600 [Carya illinoinensis]